MVSATGTRSAQAQEIPVVLIARNFRDLDKRPSAIIYFSWRAFQWHATEHVFEQLGDLVVVSAEAGTAETATSGRRSMRAREVEWSLVRIGEPVNAPVAFVAVRDAGPGLRPGALAGHLVGRPARRDPVG